MTRAETVGHTSQHDVFMRAALEAARRGMLAGEPPVGACLFVLSSVTGEKLERISIKLFPFLLAEVAILFAFAFWEDAALWLPRMLGFAQ